MTRGGRRVGAGRPKGETKKSEPSPSKEASTKKTAKKMPWEK